MADTQGDALQISSDNSENKENLSCEPVAKKPRLSDPTPEPHKQLEDRLSGILCCAVCLDLPRTCYQCVNGHLMCAGCFNHILADARLKDEAATCPNCRCEISRSACTRNLAVEKAASELPSECSYCNQKLPRATMDHHRSELCQERPTNCRFARIGCPWRGPFHEVKGHEETCIHPKKTAADVMDALQAMEQRQQEEKQLYSAVFSLLCLEKITFSDLQLKPFRTDDFITKLFYETSRFTAFNHQWVIKAGVNSQEKYPARSCERTITYQLVLKSRLNAPLKVKYMVLSGPYGETKISPAIYEHEFTSENTEAEYHLLPIQDAAECNKLVAANTINLRVILFHVGG